MKLTLALISQQTGKDIRALETLDVKDQEITDIEDIGACVELAKVDVSGNQLKSLQGIAHNKSISWLKATGNQISSMADISRLAKLAVLNLGNNQISRIQGLQAATGLKALVLNNNKLAMIENLEANVELNTLVVSHNRIYDVTNFRHLKKLKKLSVAHNRIHAIPDLSSCPELKELRINDNKIQKIPDIFALNSSMEVVDMGNNSIKDIAALEPLKFLLKLENLNLKGNPVTSLPNYKETIKKMIPTLKILDGERFDQAFLHRKLKRQILLKKKEYKEHKEKKEADADASDQPTSSPQSPPAKPTSEERAPKRKLLAEEVAQAEEPPAKKPASTKTKVAVFTKPSRPEKIERRSGPERQAPASEEEPNSSQAQEPPRKKPKMESKALLAEPKPGPDSKKPRPSVTEGKHLPQPLFLSQEQVEKARPKPTQRVVPKETGAPAKAAQQNGKNTKPAGDQKTKPSPQHSQMPNGPRVPAPVEPLTLRSGVVSVVEAKQKKS